MSRQLIVVGDFKQGNNAWEFSYIEILIGTSYLNTLNEDHPALVAT